MIQLYCSTKRILSRTLYEPVLDYVSGHLPDWIMCDFLAYWMPRIADQCRINLMFFSIFTAYTMSFVAPPPSGGGGDVHKEDKESEILNGERLTRVIRGCEAIGIRSCREFEGEYIDKLQSITKKPVVAAGGVLPPSKVVVRRGRSEEDDGRWDEVFKWLDRQITGSVVYVGFGRQITGSVVYVGFGSEYKLTKDEVYEIAYGLEMSQLPFVWALRRPTWAVDDVEALPPDFGHRTFEKGMVCLGWVPQLEILAHASVGGSLFHAGWSTIVETLQHGHNVAMLPCAHDQALNGRLMVEKGLGIKVQRREDGSYTRNDIADALKRVMLGDEANEIKARATKAAQVFGDRNLQDEYYALRFVDFLKQNPKN